MASFQKWMRKGEKYQYSQCDEMPSWSGDKKETVSEVRQIKKKIKNITVLLKTKKILIFLHMYEER